MFLDYSNSPLQIFKENLVQQVKTEAQIQVMCDHHPFLVRGPFRWQNKRNIFIGIMHFPFSRFITEKCSASKVFFVTDAFDIAEQNRAICSVMVGY